LHDVYAIDVDAEGGAPVRLTGCFAATTPCDVVEVAPGLERQRVIVRRRSDANGDGLVEAGEHEAVFSLDLSRSIEGQILTTNTGVSGIQWSSLTDTP